VLKGPILSEASYPEVLVAKAISTGNDLQLVLYPGKEAGPQCITVERLVPRREYLVKGINERTFTSDAAGRLTIIENLEGRTSIHVVQKCNEVKKMKLKLFNLETTSSRLVQATRLYQMLRSLYRCNELEEALDYVVGLNQI
jgi:hypothetical protein